MHCPTTKLIHNTMRNRSATVISHAATSRTAILTMRATLQFSQQEFTFYCCGKKGHYINYCDKRSTTPCVEWAYNKAMQHIQDEEGADTADGNDVKNWVLTNDRCTPIHPLLAAISVVGTETGRTKSATKTMTTRDHHGTSTSHNNKPIYPEHT